MTFLTGFEEPDGVLVLIPGRRAGQVVLFCRDRDPEMELWNGYRAGPEGAVADYGMDDAFPIDDIDDILPGLLEGKQHIYYSMGHNDAFDRRVMAWVTRFDARSGPEPSHRGILPTWPSCSTSSGCSRAARNCD